MNYDNNISNDGSLQQTSVMIIIMIISIMACIGSIEKVAYDIQNHMLLFLYY